jgi:hypothetical protein
MDKFYRQDSVLAVRKFMGFNAYLLTVNIFHPKVQKMRSTGDAWVV